MDGGLAVVAVRRQHRVHLSLAFARSHSPIHRSFSRCLLRRQSKIPVTSEDREKKAERFAFDKRSGTRCKRLFETSESKIEVTFFRIRVSFALIYTDVLLNLLTE